MKKYLLSLGLTTLMISCSKDPIAPQPEILVTKTIEFKIAPAADYSLPQYTGSTAQVKLQVYKQFNNPYSVQMVWDTVIARQSLTSLMSLANVPITKTVTGVKESEYKIGVGYSIEYITAPMNYTTWSAMGELTQPGNVTHKVQVGL